MFQKANPTHLLLAALCIFSVAICATRIYFTHTVSYFFLNWNLFLAFIPLAITQFLIKSNYSNKKTTLVLSLFSWLVFFPNSPYILTDLFHLRHNTAMPIWFDLMLILSYAWTGLLAGFLSLIQLEQMALSFYKPRTVHALTVFVLFLSGFGVYVGRYLRFNTWDIVSNPIHLAQDLFARFYNPSAHPRTWGVTFLMGTFLCLVYYSMKLFRTTSLKGVTSE